MRFVIFGNVGAGKSTLARALARHRKLPLLELERLVAAPRPGPAWVRAQLEAFCTASAGWVVEGRAGHLIQATLVWQPELVFLNPGPVVCLAIAASATCPRRPARRGNWTSSCSGWPTTTGAMPTKTHCARTAPSSRTTTARNGSSCNRWGCVLQMKSASDRR